LDRQYDFGGSSTWGAAGGEEQRGGMGVAGVTSGRGEGGGGGGGGGEKVWRFQGGEDGSGEGGSRTGGRPGGPECKVLTFFDPSQITGDVEEEANLLQVWQLSWLKAGWVPVVLRGEERVKAHPEYNEMLRRAVEGAGGQAMKPLVTRWLSVAAAGGGLFAHYDVINFGAPPPPNCLVGPLSTYGNLFPFLLSGQPDDFARLAEARLPLPLQAAHPAPSITGVVSPRFRFPAVRGVVRCSSATLPLFLQPDTLQLPRWQQVTSLLCAHFARTTNFQAFAIPRLATVPAALAALLSSLSSCASHTLPSFPSLLLPASPSNLTFLLLPHHISLALATDYLSYSSSPQNAPAWFKNLFPSMPVPEGLSNLEFLHALTHHLQSTPVNQEDITTDNRLSRAVSRHLNIPLTAAPLAVAKAVAGQKQEVAVARYDMAGDVVTMLQIALGFRIGREEAEALENAVRAGWEATRPFASMVHGEVLDTILMHNQVDVKLLQAAGERVEQALARAKVLES
ncbi:hypothetical protein CLOM_g461, partial [Closterium sp. NIES-68]